MWGSFDPFAQIKKKTQGFGRRRRQFLQNIQFGQQNYYNHQDSNSNNGWGTTSNNGWGESNDNGWGTNSNNNGWGTNSNNNGWGNNNNNNNNGWGESNNNGGGSNNNNNGWGEMNDNGWGSNNNNNIINNNNMWGNNMFDPVSPFQMGDIKKFVQNQIVLIEPSPQKKKLEELKRNGQVFKDQRFPPNQQSLCGQWGSLSEWKEIKWTPISQGIKNPKIFEGKIQPCDISQGYLGDCYFLAALAALAQRPDRIAQLFLLKELNEQKYYSVKMLYRGKWMTIDMDEYVPFLHGKPAFTKAKQSQLWVILLQKAWAKLYGSYKRIQAGYPEEGLHDLTGAPIRQIALQGHTFDKQKQWRYLVDASQREYSMVSSSQAGSDTNKSVSGVVQGHAYTFLNATCINFQGRQVRIVQLRNPWGKGEFTGRWSDKDPNWAYVSPQDKARVGFRLNVDDGIFFMGYDEYCKQFRALTVCEIDDNASYIYKSHTDPHRKGCFFKVKIFKAGNYSFHVDETPERAYQDQIQNSFSYPLAQIQIGRWDGSTVSGKKGTNSRKRTLYYDIDIEAGEYIVFVRIHYDKNFQKDFNVNLAVYAEFACQISLASQQQAVSFSGNPNVNWKGEQTKSNGAWNNLMGYGALQSQVNNYNNNDGWQQNNNNNGWQKPKNNGWEQSYNSGWQQPNNVIGKQNFNNNGWQQQNSNWGQGQSNSNNNGWGQTNTNNANNQGYGHGQGNNNYNNGW